MVWSEAMPLAPNSGKPGTGSLVTDDIARTSRESYEGNKGKAPSERETENSPGT